MSDTSATQIVILGGGGDLSQRKLLPALFDLYLRDMLPVNFHIIGLARSERSDEDYRTFVQQALTKHVTPKEGKHRTLKDFCDRVSYVSGSFDEESTYGSLHKALGDFDEQEGRANRLFYLAVPPKFYGQIFRDLKGSGVAEEAEGKWTHILVEKPFGHNLETAQALDAELADLYREDQIFRIDHYLAKEAVQNILSFRFANTLLKAPWNKDAIESVTITMTETLDVGDRTNFYEGVGALRDVGQNHLLQLLALTAMREPAEFTVKSIRDARTEVLEALVPIDQSQLELSVLRAQYDDYKTHEHIPDTSETETYFELRAEVNLPEWEGVPFYIRSGKALDQAEVSITVQFKDVASGMFETQSCLSKGNVVKLTISPEQVIEINLNAKEPGLGFQLEDRNLRFVCEKGDVEIKNSYEKVLYDSIIGDQTLFTRTEEVLAAWKYITPIIDMWQDLPLYTYTKGSTGPDQTIIL
ncbi:MAG: glucose-6-phosphate dehydrogenase [Candidatus Kaiserbacteria bacterium]|nr:glucose-6-phosphate dehydrogenase [Candidatus Kaiserbacteria bacterium]MCB9816060.1 glucose-6-phosphate dehydrogenase [Candidatus Nomurabacteria bacterium]